MGRSVIQGKENTNGSTSRHSSFESFDALDWDLNEVRDLVHTTPLRYDDEGLPVGYELEQLFGLEAAHDE